ncbi:UNVERIFIED_CONTAM: hypothetical protein Sradi_1554600 [Sesamum radiatum]|uniref:Reverse transcriptase domain-containing protein n=1 Tax=Sesamum radiatum TaxID=300843 RepID=A0AAW2U8L3_SESRA
MTEKVDLDMNFEQLKPYYAEEIVDAISHMAPLKSPGPDGMPPIVVHKFRRITKNDVINSVLSILNDRSLKSSLNFTHIVLIPKCNKPDVISQFRPISLCNVVMKIATKCIANQLEPLLDRIISPTQFAFIPGRLISDNILIAFEISKAYYKVEWSFLRKAIRTHYSSSRTAPAWPTLTILISVEHRWLIGDGHKIKIWIDPLILEKPSFRPSVRLDPLPPPIMVDYPFVAEDGDWNVPMIESIFPLHDVQSILSIPIGRTSLQGEIIWHYMKSGSFLVKSAYHLPFVLARDHNDNCLAWLSRRLHGTIGLEIAEAWAAQAVIDLGHRSHRDKIILEGDCANLVKQLVDREGYSSSTEVLIHYIFALCP